MITDVINYIMNLQKGNRDRCFFKNIKNDGKYDDRALLFMLKYKTRP
jgi:hypothetical protein